MVETENGLPLVDELRKYGNSKCKNPRDKIYGLLSLLPANDPARAYILVDYEKPIGDLFVDLLKYLCAFYVHGSFDILDILDKIKRWLDIDLQTAGVKSLTGLSSLSSAQGQRDDELEINGPFVSLPVMDMARAPRSNSRIYGAWTLYETEAEDSVNKDTLSLKSSFNYSEASQPTYPLAGHLKNHFKRLDNLENQTFKIFDNSNPSMTSGRILVHNDTEPNDKIAMVAWYPHQENHSNFMSKFAAEDIRYSCAVLRKDPRSERWKLRSWAIHLSGDEWSTDDPFSLSLPGHSERERLSLPVLVRPDDRRHELDMKLSLHYLDMLAYVLLERCPEEAVMSSVMTDMET